MIVNNDIRLRNGIVKGIHIKLKNSNLIIINAPNGFLMCGYLDMKTANKLGDIAAMVTGVNTIGDALDAKIMDLSNEAKKMGLKKGITGRAFLNSIL